MQSPIKVLKNNKGMALLVTIFSTMFMMFIAEEVAREARIEFEVSSQSVKKIQAYYAAKSGVEMGLLKVLLYKKAQHSLGEKLGENRSMLDMIWKMPFTWPPEAPENLNLADKGLLKKAVDNSLMNSQYYVVIESEGSKIDLNDLASESKALAKSTKEQLLKIFKDELESNDTFQEKYNHVDFEELIANFQDWVDEDDQRVQGGPESQAYRDFDTDSIPPNMAFKTFDEIRMVAGMNDDFYKLLKLRATVYGNKGINVNSANKEVLKSIDEQLTDEILKAIEEHINNPEKGPFSDLKTFKEFLEEEGVYIDEFNPHGIPLHFEEEFNFRITSTGIISNITKSIEVVTFDIENLKENLIKALDQDDKNNGKTLPTADNEDPSKPKPKNDKPKDNKPKKKAPKGRPTIVYWHET